MHETFAASALRLMCMSSILKSWTDGADEFLPQSGLGRANAERGWD